MLIFGPLLTLIVIFYPTGIAGVIQSIFRKFRSSKKEKNKPLTTIPESSNVQSREV